MFKESISNKQGIFLIIFFILDAAIMLPIGIEAKKDLWLATLLSLFISIPFIYIYSKILSFYPGLNLFEILELSLGKYIGKIIGLMYILFVFHLASIILRDFGEYFITLTLLETPIISMMIPPLLLSIWFLKSGIEVFVRVNYILGVLFLILIIVMSIFLINKINIDNIKPIFSNGFNPIFKGAYSIFTFPLGETVLFTAILSSLNNKKSYFKVYFLGTLIGGLFLFIIKFIEISVLGYNHYSLKFFPGNTTLTRINIKMILLELEMIGSIIFTFSTIIKLTVCTFAYNIGIQKLFNFNDYRFIVIPTSLLLLNLSYFIYDGVLELVEWSSKIWPYYSIPFLIVIPIIVFIILIIKKNDSKLIKFGGL